MSQGMSQWLAGVRILDLSQYIPGPLASLLLADMGADVLKIEPPSGDPMQTLGPRNHAGEGLFHQTLNAGKRILRIDLKHPKGREALLALAREADVLIEGFRPGVMERLGLGIGLLRARRCRKPDMTPTILPRPAYWIAMVMATRCFSIRRLQTYQAASLRRSRSWARFRGATGPDRAAQSIWGLAMSSCRFRCCRWPTSARTVRFLSDEPPI
ncbi:MAG: hypothetical protein EBT33_03140 [Betaproteobacteria bacterium]|nr:hypothetical protein [Betaproteobacteria bacterium]